MFDRVLNTLLLVCWTFPLVVTHESDRVLNEERAFTKIKHYSKNN